jgi:kumamolisin
MSEHQQPLPENYERLDGSERRPSPTATLLGPADENEHVEVTITLRRRTDGKPLPEADHFLVAPSQRQRLSNDEFAASYGASDEDIRQVTDFATSHGLTVVDTHAARRSVIVSGTVKQLSKAFAVKLSKYQHEITRGRGHEHSQTETYRGRDGYIHVPRELVDIVDGVFGLDNRSIVKRNGGDPAGTAMMAVTQATSLYNFPTNSAAGQTIAIFSLQGYQAQDIAASFTPNPPPHLTDVSVDGRWNNGQPSGETTQDIYIAAAAAPGANIAVYFTQPTLKGWVDLLHRVAHPNAGDPVCSVLSSSYYICDGDDPTTLARYGITAAGLNASSAAFQDAAVQNVTVCIASGDTGTDSKIGDGKAHVQYPTSDPWVLSVGGTTVSPLYTISWPLQRHKNAHVRADWQHPRHILRRIRLERHLLWGTAWGDGWWHQ